MLLKDVLELLKGGCTSSLTTHLHDEPYHMDHVTRYGPPVYEQLSEAGQVLYDLDVKAVALDHEFMAVALFFKPLKDVSASEITQPRMLEVFDRDCYGTLVTYLRENTEIVQLPRGWYH